MRVPDESKKQSHQDWLNWEGRWELIHGKAYHMTPAPSADHQFVVGELFFALRRFFGDKGCEVFVSPFDVFLGQKASDDDAEHIVQPDISVICDKRQISQKGCLGAPQLVIEVLSPATALKDFNEKFQLYEQSGVNEYWIADPLNRLVHVHAWADGYYTRRGTFGEGDKCKSMMFEGLTCDLHSVFRTANR